MDIGELYKVSVSLSSNSITIRQHMTMGKIVAYSPLLYLLHTNTIKINGDFMIRERLGNRIKALRQQTGLSQEKFALKIGMDRTYFASVEAGKRNVAIVNLEKIANGLEISLSELFHGV